MTYPKFHLFLHDSSASKVTKFSDEISSPQTLFSHLLSWRGAVKLTAESSYMQISQQEFAETYRGLPDEEIASLFADSGSLTTEAHSALMAEITRRGLNEPQLQELHSVEVRHEAQFDRLERIRRNRMVLKDLGLNDPKGWIIGILGAGLLLLIEEYLSNHH